MRSHSEEAFLAKGKEQASPKGADVGDYWSRKQGEPHGSGFHAGASANIWAQLFPGALSAAVRRLVLQQWNRMALSSLATVSQ